MRYSYHLMAVVVPLFQARDVVGLELGENVAIVYL